MAMRGCVWTLRGARFGRTWTQGISSGVRPGSTETEVPQIQFIDFVVVGSLQFLDRAGYCRYATEPGTHSFKLCFMDWIDMPVVVHVKVVDISGVAQTDSHGLFFQRFHSYSTLTR